MSHDSLIVNPYRPTTGVSQHASANTVLDAETAFEFGWCRDRAIRFTGGPSRDDVEELLRLTATPGLAWMVLLPVVFVCLAVLVNATWPWTMAAVGFALLLLVLVSILSRSYRRADFTAFNPHWDQVVGGWVDGDGYRVESDGILESIRWTGVSNAFVSERLVAFHWGTHVGHYHLVPRRMVTSDEDWDLLCTLADSIHCEASETSELQERVSRMDAIHKSADRPTIDPVPDGAISFGGPITGRDMSEHEFSWSQQRVFVRCFFYAVIGLVGLAAILAGIAGLFYQANAHDGHPGLLLASFAVGVFSLFGLWIGMNYFRECSPRRVDHYQQGFATDRSLTLDRGWLARTTSWLHLRVADEQEDRIILVEPEYERYATVKSAMFSSPDQWRKFVDLARSRAEA